MGEMIDRGCASAASRHRAGGASPLSPLRGLSPDGRSSTDAGALPLVTAKVRKPDFSLFANPEECERIWNGELS